MLEATDRYSFFSLNWRIENTEYSRIYLETISVWKKLNDSSTQGNESFQFRHKQRKVPIQTKEAAASHLRQQRTPATSQIIGWPWETATPVSPGATTPSYPSCSSPTDGARRASKTAPPSRHEWSRRRGRHSWSFRSLSPYVSAASTSGKIISSSDARHVVYDNIYIMSIPVLSVGARQVAGFDVAAPGKVSYCRRLS